MGIVNLRQLGRDGKVSALSNLKNGHQADVCRLSDWLQESHVVNKPPASNTHLSAIPRAPFPWPRHLPFDRQAQLMS